MIKIAQEHITQLTNSRLDGLLLDGHNISPLEELLNAETQELERLQRLKEECKLDFGQKLNSQELGDLFLQIKEEVDAFLGVGNIDTPHFGYFSLFRRPTVSHIPVLLYYAQAVTNLGVVVDAVLNNPNLITNTTYLPKAIGSVGIEFFAAALIHRLFAGMDSYDRITGSINLSRRNRATLILIGAHEYTHYVQARTGWKMYFKYSGFREGHARGVERYLANQYREKEDNEAFLYGVVKSTVEEMRNTYVWICKKLGVKPSESLLKAKSSLGRHLEITLQRPSSHARGNTLLYLHEAVNGNQIYRGIINGNYEFLVSPRHTP